MGIGGGESAAGSSRRVRSGYAPCMASQLKSASGRILRNSFWYGLETLLETLVFVGTSVAVARYLGPQKLGYFSYINFFVGIVTRASGTGLASATRKYMSEFLAADEPGMARAVYHFAYKYQLLGAVAITALGIAGVTLFGDPAFRTMSIILIASIIPGIMSWVPANANNAFEDVSKNTFSAFAYLLSYLAMIALTIHFHWDLVGVAATLFVARSVEVVLRTIPLHRRLGTMPLAALDAAVKERIRRFCLEAVGIQILTAVVWDRSEMIFLKAFSSLEQIAFYSVSFGLANNLLVVPRTFGSATGLTLMVEAGRAPERVNSIVRNACRYLLLVALPVHLGAAAITRQAIGLAYGPKYAGAVPVLMVAAILSIPRAFQELPEVLMRAADKQKQLLIWFSITGVVNLALDALLIPRYAAVGAAWGNGLAQTFGIVAIWYQAKRFFRFNFPVAAALRLTAAGALMALLAYLAARKLPNVPGMGVGIAVALPSFIVLVRLFGGLQFGDRARLAAIGDRLPGPARGVFAAVVDFATPAVEKPREVPVV